MASVSAPSWFAQLSIRRLLRLSGLFQGYNCNRRAYSCVPHRLSRCQEKSPRLDRDHRQCDIPVDCGYNRDYDRRSFAKSLIYVLNMELRPKMICIASLLALRQYDDHDYRFYYKPDNYPQYEHLTHPFPHFQQELYWQYRLVAIPQIYRQFPKVHLSFYPVWLAR